MKTFNTPMLPLLLALFATSTQASGLPCPTSPNCVSSLEQGEHFIPPLELEGLAPDETREKLLETLADWPDTAIVTGKSPEQNTVINAVITSKWLKFKDDLTLIIRPDGKVDVRSSSRTGYYDFGVNRRRIEQLRAALAP